MNTTDVAHAKRRQQITNAAAGPAAEPNPIVYTPEENRVWEIVSTKLQSLWEQEVADEVLEARDVIKLPLKTVPQLSEVTAKLAPLSGFAYRAVPGLVDINLFFGSLAHKNFLSTQYLRHPSSPLYTPEPDLIHEVIGHGTLLADPRLAHLHELAGQALLRVSKPSSRQFIANVWWFSGEFGVLATSRGIKALGAGLLSSVGELGQFGQGATIRSLDIAAMGTIPYRIDRFQKDLFAAESVEHLMAEVGGFFEGVTDERIEELISQLKIRDIELRHRLRHYQ